MTDNPAERRYREADEADTTRFRVTAKIFASVFDDTTDTVLVWEGTRGEIEALAAAYSETRDEPFLHMEIDTVEVLDA